MTVFYFLMYRLWLRAYEEKESHGLSAAVCALTVVRIILCLFPQNRWLENDSPVIWGIIRNIPFVVLGGIIVWLFWRKKEAIRAFRFVWLLITLSFLFYIPVQRLPALCRFLAC